MKTALLAWTMYWSSVTGIRSPQVVFEPLPGRITGRSSLEAWIGARGLVAIPQISYDVSKKADPKWLALHEVCHHRMQHVMMRRDEISNSKMEQEAETCVRVYISRLARRETGTKHGQRTRD